MKRRELVPIMQLQLGFEPASKCRTNALVTRPIKYTDQANKDLRYPRQRHKKRLNLIINSYHYVFLFSRGFSFGQVVRIDELRVHYCAIFEVLIWRITSCRGERVHVVSQESAGSSNCHHSRRDFPYDVVKSRSRSLVKLLFGRVNERAYVVGQYDAARRL